MQTMDPVSAVSLNHKTSTPSPQRPSDPQHLNGQARCFQTYRGTNRSKSTEFAEAVHEYNLTGTLQAFCMLQ